MTATVIIPARLGSTRFPAKIVASSTGRPLVQHVVDQVRQCQRVRQVIVASDDQQIIDAVQPFGTLAVMTHASHQSGTDRIAEVATGLEDEIIVNVQGDEPEIEPEIIDRLIERLQTSDDQMATAATAFPPAARVEDPNLVKVVINQKGYALYFSRCPIPYWCDPDTMAAPTYFLHLGIYAYRRQFLLDFSSWQPSRLEMAEKLEQLRVLDRGQRIFVLKADRATHGIDTPAQYEEFVERFNTRRQR